jgi:hypothetical protein
MKRRRDGRGEKIRQCSIGAMRGFLVFVASGLGIGAIWRRRRRSAVAALPYAGPIHTDEAEDGPDHAAELRAKLAESKAVEAHDGEPDGAKADEPPTPAVADGPEGRRHDVHDRARAAIDELG